MEIGIHPNISNEDYHKDISAISHSGLCKFEVAPRVYWWEVIKGNRQEETAAKEFGKWFHEALLEPEIFQKRYFTDSEIYKLYPNRTRKAYKDAFKEIEGLHEGKELIKHKEWINIHGMLDSVKLALIQNALKLGYPELTLCWNDPETGLLCKARPDFLREDGIIIDVKTTDDASQEGFIFSNEKYKYYRQAAFYMRGATILKEREYTKCVLIAVEKTPPWLYNVFEIPQQQLWEGERQIKKLLPKFKQCKDQDQWPGYHTEKQVTILDSTDRFIRKVTEELDSESE